MENANVLMLGFNSEINDLSIIYEQKKVIYLDSPKDAILDDFQLDYPISQSMPRDWYI